jgi:hypothetical protein
MMRNTLRPPSPAAGSLAAPSRSAYLDPPLPPMPPIGEVIASAPDGQDTLQPASDGHGWSWADVQVDHLALDGLG